MSRYGLILVSRSIADQVSLAKHAEAAGLHSVWTTEFFNQHGFVRLAAVAAATERVKLGTAIAYALMRTPLLAAAAAMDIDEMSQGRVILGLGTGTRTMNEKWYSIPFDHPPAPRIGEAVRLIRAAFAAASGGGLQFDGGYYTISIPQYERRGATRESIPIYLAAVNKGMIRAASRTDGLVGHPVFTRRYISEKVLPALEGTSCELAPYVICSVSDDPDEARREARAQIGSTTRLGSTTRFWSRMVGSRSVRRSPRRSASVTSQRWSLRSPTRWSTPSPQPAARTRFATGSSSGRACRIICCSTQPRQEPHRSACGKTRWGSWTQ